MEPSSMSSLRWLFLRLGPKRREKNPGLLLEGWVMLSGLVIWSGVLFLDPKSLAKMPFFWDGGFAWSELSLLRIALKLAYATILLDHEDSQSA
jgi:hypothetical protein